MQWYYITLHTVTQHKIKKNLTQKKPYNIRTQALCVIEVTAKLGGYPLNSISKNIKLNKYFSEMTQIDQENVQEQEDDVIEFIAKNV